MSTSYQGLIYFIHDQAETANLLRSSDENQRRLVMYFANGISVLINLPNHDHYTTDGKEYC